MKSQQTIGENRHHAYQDPENWRDAELKMIVLDRETRIMEAQLGDPNAAKNKTPDQWGVWRAKVLKAIAWKKSEYKMTKLWLKDETQRRSDMLLRSDGISDPNDPLVLLAHLHRVSTAIIKRLNAHHSVLDEEWFVLDKARSLVKGN